MMKFRVMFPEMPGKKGFCDRDIGDLEVLFFFLSKEGESAEQLPGRRITMVK